MCHEDTEFVRIQLRNATPNRQYAHQGGDDQEASGWLGHAEWRDAADARAVDGLDAGDVVGEKLAGAEAAEAVKDRVHVGACYVGVVQTDDVADFVNGRAQDVRIWRGSNFLPAIAMVVLHLATGTVTVTQAGCLCFRDRSGRGRRIAAINVDVTEAKLSEGPVGHFDKVDVYRGGPNVERFFDGRFDQRDWQRAVVWHQDAAVGDVSNCVFDGAWLAEATADAWSIGRPWGTGRIVGQRRDRVRTDNG
jgi:hypothetical protein